MREAELRIPGKRSLLHHNLKEVLVQIHPSRYTEATMDVGVWEMLYLILDVKLGSTVCVIQQSDKMQEQQWYGGLGACTTVPKSHGDQRKCILGLGFPAKRS